ncbi:MAG: S8 family peptidase [Gemmatimonadota bacterium]
MKSKLVLLAATAAALGACADDPTRPDPASAENPAASAGLAPLYSVAQQDPALKDRYAVVFFDSVRDVRGVTGRLAQAHGARVHYTYTHVIKGFAATLPPQAVEALRRDPRVRYIEADKPIRHTDVQATPPWGLDRIDQRPMPLRNEYVYNERGSGVTVYVVDSGIRTSHPDFGGRATVGYDAFGGNGQDCLGHGTHVAGTVGGATYGVAKNASLVAVRVLDCSGNGSLTGLVNGLDWVRQNHPTGSVANISIAVTQNGVETTSSTVDNAVDNLINSRVTVVVSAGNDGKDACGVSPARVANAITVGASNESDQRATWPLFGRASNYGSCVDLFAPGNNIPSANWASDTQPYVESGTSMAAPHVAGVAARLMQHQLNASPSNIRTQIVSGATSGVLGNIGSGSPNRLLWAAPMGVGISGPGVVTSQGSYTWEAVPTGGNGSYTYSWDIEWLDHGYRSNNVHSGKTLSLDVFQQDGEFILTARAFSGADVAETSHMVCNFIYPNDVACL